MRSQEDSPPELSAATSVHGRAGHALADLSGALLTVWVAVAFPFAVPLVGCLAALGSPPPAVRTQLLLGTTSGLHHPHRPRCSSHSCSFKAWSREAWLLPGTFGRSKWLPGGACCWGALSESADESSAHPGDTQCALLLANMQGRGGSGEAGFSAPLSTSAFYASALVAVTGSLCWA